jgi:hypothetical protein
MTTPAHDDKGAYKVVLDEEQEGVYGSSRTGSLSARSPPPPSHFDHLLNHPALPVLCYCASSILMTVRLGSPFLPRSHCVTSGPELTWKATIPPAFHFYRPGYQQ